MSVRGEFTRSAGLLLDFLEENHPASGELRKAIGEARDLAKENISGGAEEILHQVRQPRPPCGRARAADGRSRRI